MNRDEFLKAVKEDPYQIENAEAAFKKDKEIVLIAVSQNGSVLEYAHASLKKDREVVLAAVKNAGNAIEFADKLFRKDKEISEQKLQDTMLIDGLIDSYNQYHMGITAENVAKKYNITRNEQDLYAFNSQTKANKANKSGKFKDEIVSVKINNKDFFYQDEHPRIDSNLDKLSKLKTVFKESGTVTAGNSSGINDGAATVVLMNLKTAINAHADFTATVASAVVTVTETSHVSTGYLTIKTFDSIRLTAVNEGKSQI